MRLLRYLLFFVTVTSVAQKNFTIRAAIPQAANKEIILKGYGFTDMPGLFKVKADAGGNFVLSYPQDYIGAALLEIKDSKSVIVLLNHENFSMQWQNVEDFNSLTFKNSPENDAFALGMATYQDVEVKRAALAYLVPLYSSEPQKKDFFNTELSFQDGRMSSFFNTLPKNTYSHYYVNLRKLIADMSKAVTHNDGRFAFYGQEFNRIDFADARLVHSGLYKELLESYFVLMETSGQQYNSINAATDGVLSGLVKYPELKQDVAAYLFRLFEQRSLFPAAEHLALTMLNDAGCTVDAEREALFEQYRKMAKGNTAPDIVLFNSNKSYKKLSDIKTKYKLVIFGAGWCPTCREEAPKLLKAYPEWKKRNLEIVYISLDTDKSSFTSFTNAFPWVTATDYKSWEGAAPRSYFVSGTPTLYLLDDSNKILLKPVSADQVSAWLDVNK